MQEQENNNQQSGGFYGLGIAPRLLDILEGMGFKSPTPIQTQAIPSAIEGKDVVGIAQTGTGKTLAFGIPMIQRLEQVGGQGLIVLPTRELAIQVDEALMQVGKHLQLRTAVLIGGVNPVPQLRALARKPNIIIATPGRLIDHLQQRNIRLDTVKIAILDEADRMLDMGFAPQINQILKSLPKEKQMMLFSATMPPEIMRMAAGHMKLPIRIEIAPAGTTAERVTQELFVLPGTQKTALLIKLLEKYRGSTIVFSRTKHGAKKITRQLKMNGTSAAEIHSNRSLGQRREALEGFKSGRYRVLIATDIASRGIDVNGIELVVNYDLPSNSDDYVHRIGRTARAGAAGHAITFAMPGELREVRAIERLIRKQLPMSRLPELPFVQPLPAESFSDRDDDRRPSRGFQRRPHGNSSQRSNNSFRRPRR